jgi:hypothetical protein
VAKEEQRSPTGPHPYWVLGARDVEIEYVFILGKSNDPDKLITLDLTA